MWTARRSSLQRGKSLQRPNSVWRIRMAENPYASSSGNGAGLPVGSNQGAQFQSAVPAVPTLQLLGVSKSFGAVQALTDVDFEVYAGEVVGLVGDNGAGKSTLIKCISGIYPIDGGAIRFEGRPVTIHGPQDSAGLGIETVYQDLALCDNLDVVGNLFLGRERNQATILNEVAMEQRAIEILRGLAVSIPSVRTLIA